MADSRTRQTPPAEESRHLRVVRGRPASFPTPLTGFIGRERELGEVERRLERTRLLTLTGPGGSGKTRLAIEAATRAMQRFPDGAAWVELAPLADGAMVPQAVAAALELRVSSGGDPVEGLLAHLRQRQMLLVLDNCEHLVEASAAMADRLLRGVPGLRVLATSREALRIEGEMAWRVPPLGLPDPAADAERIGESEAVRLFLERARAVMPDFTLTPANGADVAGICQRLDGIPLAIELAAARVRLLAPAQIAERLDDCFRLLSERRRGAVPRQQTLRATMEWSYDLLSPPERLLFARLAVFAGGFTLEAAEAICAGEGIPGGELLDLLTQLVDRSLVVVEEEEGEARCRLLETIRQYAAERLQEAEEADAVRARHAAWYLALAERLEPELSGLGVSEAMDRLEAEHDNLRAALRRFISNRDATGATRLTGALWRFWQTRGYFAEGRHWLAEALALPLASGEPGAIDARARSLHGAGVLAWGQGEYEPAAAQFEEGLALYEEIEDSGGIAALHNNLAVIALHRGEYDRARALFEVSLRLRRQQGDQRGIATVLNNLGAIAGKQGELTEARRFYEESLLLQRQIGNTQGAAVSLANLGAAAYEQGEFGEAERFLAEALALRRLLGDRAGVGDALGKLGRVALRQGEMARAREHFAASFPLLRELGDRERMAGTMMAAAAIGLAQGEVGAARLLGAAAALREAIGAPLTAEERTEQDRIAAEARVRLEEPAYEALHAEGRVMPLEEATAMTERILGASAGDALHAPSASPPSPSPSPSPAPVAPRITRSAEVELRILALGPLQVVRQGVLVSAAEWGSAKPRELLMYLLSHPQGRTKEQIGLALWPDASPAQLRNSFHVTLHHLRRAVGDAGWVLFERERYRFASSRPHAYDVEEFRTALEQVEMLPPDDRVGLLEGAIALYRGDFLEETLFGDWILPLQDELRRRCLDALVQLGELHLARADPTAALDAFRRALARDNLLERAHRGLMRALAATGERDRALAHYRVLEALLEQELGVAPSAETREVVEGLRG